jgi:hypothetical protein
MIAGFCRKRKFAELDWYTDVYRRKGLIVFGACVLVFFDVHDYHLMYDRSGFSVEEPSLFMRPSLRAFS